MIGTVRYFVLIISLLFSQAKIYCQKILDPPYNPPDVRFDNFLIKNGEASQESTSILIDSKGFVWSGTETGLYCFDGIKYLSYGIKRGNYEGFTGFFVTSILEDSDGAIWIGTSEALNKLDKKSGTFLSFIPDTTVKRGNGNFIRYLGEDSDGLLWVLTNEDIYSFDRKAEKFTKFPTDSLSHYSQNSLFIHEDQCFAEDDYGNKWFTTNHGLYLYDNRNKTFRMVLPDRDQSGLSDIVKVNCVKADENGNVWIGTNGGGLLKWNFNENRPELTSIRATRDKKGTFADIRTILTDRKGYIWTFGNASFSGYNTENDSIDNYLILYRHRTVWEAPGSAVWINQAFLNDDGTIWFINYTAGLVFRFDPVTEKLSLYRTPYFMVYQSVMDKTGSLWFACIRNNLFRLETARIPFFTINNMANTAHVAQVHKKNIIEDHQGQMWLLFNYGTYVFNRFDISSGDTPQQFRFPGGYTASSRGLCDCKGNLWFIVQPGKILRYNPLSKHFRDLTPDYPGVAGPSDLPFLNEDKEGNIWLLHPHFGLYLINKGDSRPVHVLNINDGPDAVLIMDFLVDSSGNIWILSGDAFLQIVMPEKNIIRYTDYGDDLFSAFASNVRIAEGKDGNILILNNKSGLFRYNRQNDTFIKIEFIDEGPDSQYYDLLSDRTGRIWIAHNRGISIYDPRNNHTRLIRTPKLQFDIQSYQANSGQILYVNHNQLYVFNEEVPLNDYIPPVYITRMVINGTDFNNLPDDGRKLNSREEIKLPYNLNSFSFEFAALNYLDPARNRYRYFLSGFDEDTTETVSGLPAEYRQIPPGRYRFWVTGSNNDGLWNPEGTFLEIRIKPPWYSSLPAYLIYFAFVVSMITGYIKLRTYRLMRDKIRLQSEITAATAELELKNRQLKETDRIKNQFLTDISHEIRTPLTLIAGPLENISKEEILSSRMSEMIELMRRNADRLINLVNQLLDISRLDAGKMKIRLVEDDLVRCLKILVYDFLTVAEKKQINYIVDLPEKSFKVLFDRDKTEKIISNLLTNAFKYTPQNGTVRFNLKISHDSQFLAPMIHIEVIDTGPGISKENHERIFEKFYRVEGHQEACIQGTGIGLSLAYGLVSLLHGEIKVISDPGKGAEFHVSFPLGKDHLSSDEYIILQEKAEGSEDHSFFRWKEKIDAQGDEKSATEKLKILVVEDNEDLRNYIKDNLAGQYNVIMAENGRLGLNIAFTNMPDLIVSDIIMPDIDGISLCLKIKRDERTSHIPVILLTAKATLDNRLEGLRASADDYLVKPFSMEELKVRIANLITLRDRLRLKYHKFQLPVNDRGTTLSVDDRFMVKVFRVINDNYRYYAFDVKHLQEELGMSKTHLIRKLKILTGLSPGRLIRNIRLEKAAELLLGRKGNITEVSNSVGLSNPSYFTKAFRAHFGVSPRDYIRHKKIL